MKVSVMTKKQSARACTALLAQQGITMSDWRDRWIAANKETVGLSYLSNLRNGNTTGEGISEATLRKVAASLSVTPEQFCDLAVGRATGGAK